MTEAASSIETLIFLIMIRDFLHAKLCDSEDAMGLMEPIGPIGPVSPLVPLHSPKHRENPRLILYSESKRITKSKGNPINLFLIIFGSMIPASFSSDLISLNDNRFM